jgi:hypothetical protein
MKKLRASINSILGKRDLNNVPIWKTYSFIKLNKEKQKGLEELNEIESKK